MAVDDDISAYSGRVRPGYDEIMDAIEQGTIGALVAWAPDRLHRSPAELETFIDTVERAGVEVATVQAGRVDLATPAGRMQARMLGNVARFESEHRSARTRRAHEQIAAEGRWKGGRRPYGYRPQPDGSMLVDPVEAEVIREAVRRVLDGETVGSVASDLQRRGVSTVTGAPWRSATLRRIVASPTIAGRRIHRGEDVGAGQWEPIVSPDTVAEVSILLEHGPKRGRLARVALLSGGRARCAACELPMVTYRTTGGIRHYRCLRCFVQIRAEWFEDEVGRGVVDRLEATPLPEQIPATGTSEAAAIQAKIDERLALLADEVIEVAEFRQVVQPLRDQLRAIHAAGGRRMRPGLRSYAGPGVASAIWPDAPLTERQRMFDAVCEGVTVARSTEPGRNRELGRISFRWIGPD